MSQERLEQLFSFLKDEPNDPFTLYAIATEYNTFDQKKARLYFDQLLQDHPDYVPTYYHAAKLYDSFGEKEEAGNIYRKGIEKAKSQQDRLALRELQNAYNEFLFDEEDD